MTRKPRSFRPMLEPLGDRCLPSTLTVTTNLDNGAAGSLRAEIAAAAPGDTIVFAPALNGQAIAPTSQLEIRKSLTIQGPGAGQLTVGDPSGAPRLFQVDAGVSVTLSGLSITGGGGRADPSSFDPSPWDGYGGGVLNLGTLTVSGCTLSGNSVSVYPAYGGGIYNAGTLTVTGSTLSGNSATKGGAIFNDGTIYRGGGTLTVSGSTLSGNSAAGYGGGVYNDKATATVSGSTLSANTAGYGGGIYNYYATLTVSGCTLSGNSASFQGGGIYNGKSAKVSILSSVVRNNVAPLGADLYNLGTAKVSTDSTVGVIGP